MVGETSGNGGCALNPANPPAADRYTNPQALMGIAEIVGTADDIHTGDKCLGLAGQMASATGQVGESLAKCAIEPLNVSRVDECATETLDEQALNQRLAALNDTPVNAELASRTLLDDLHNGDVWPGKQAATSSLTSAGQRRTEGTSKSTYVAGQAIHRQ